MLKNLQQRGDTIVEVLIVVIVIATVIGSAYSIAVKSLQSTQRTQERSYALKLAETQLERLKAASTGANAASVLAVTQSFCLDATLTKTLNTIGSSLPSLNNDDFSRYNANCISYPSGSSDCASYCYYTSLLQTAGGSFDKSYTASVRWDGPNGNRQQVQLSYKVYQ